MPSQVKPPVVILGLGVNGLSIINSLSLARGIEMIGVAQSRNDVGLHSRFLKEKIILKDSFNEKEIIENLVVLGKKLKYKSVLFMESDFFVSTVDRNREELMKYYLFNIHGPDLSEIFKDKNKMVLLAEKNGLCTPKNLRLKNNKHKNNVRYPIVLKPINSYNLKNWNISNFGRKAVLIEREEDLEKFVVNNDGIDKEVIAQEYIQGSDTNYFWCHAYADLKGSTSKVFVTRKIYQYKPIFGTGSYVISIKCEFLERMTERFLKRINYRGAISIEYKYKDGEFYFIEMNPRRPLHNMLLSGSGFNLPILEYCDLTGIITPFNSGEVNRYGKKWIRADSEIKRILLFGNKKIVRLLKVFTSILKSDYYSVFNIRDIKPYLFSMFLSFNKLSIFFGTYVGIKLNK